MRVALLTEGARPHPQRGAGDWCDRLAAAMPEHEFERYRLTGSRPRPPRRAPGARRGRPYAEAYEQLVRALVLPGERAGFASGLYRLAALAREDGALPAFLASAPARRLLERTWRLPGADTSAGQPPVRDLLAAADLLERWLRPLSAPWYGTGPGGLGAADLCHVVGGGPAVLPALVARQLHGVPFLVTEHRLHLREQYLGHHEAPYGWPVRALRLSFSRELTGEAYRQAAILTPGSAHDQRWQRRCGADPARTRVVYEGTPEAGRPAAGPEPAAPTLVWAGALEPGRGPEPALHALARIRAEVPGARLVVHGEQTAPGHRAHCEAVARRLGVGEAVRFAGRPGPLAEVWASGTVVVFSGLSRHSPRLLADAMLSGRAVVSTDVGVAREVVGPTGLLVPAGDPGALAGACLALLRDEERRGRLGLAGRLRAQERFAVEPEIGAFREIYLELVSRHPAFPAGEGGPVARPFARPAEYWLAEGPRGGGSAVDSRQPAEFAGAV
ncbi:glycosyltransferase [Kitasatospora brasiliensis]|uniref:glycosyltransferase n=1 Tax=Kitasatospora brasiliensis TaxID=3058040 RepID=UPI00292F2AE8|nr:glycosyltransferase [Kitasatospora sp. K002]